MANRAVTLYRKVKTPEGWRRYPAVMAANGKIKPDVVIVGGAETRYPVGHYELRSFNGSLTVWTRIKGGASEALAALKVSQKKAAVRADADDADVQIVEDDKRTHLDTAKKKYLDAVLARGSMESHEVYGRSINNFLDTCGKRYADQISNEDIAAFHASMRRQGLSDRTISNRHGHVRSFLKYLGLEGKKLNDVSGATPRYEKTLPEIYEPAELKNFFASLTEEYDTLLFDVLHRCGLREREATHIEYPDLNKLKGVVKIQSKPRWNFKVKDAEEREVPIPTDLMKRLLKRQKSNSGMKLIFGAQGGKLDVPEGHLLRRLKTLARNADLNCGACKCCADNRECEHWYLHKFRATYITTLLRNGVDLRSVMKLSGHSDLESVMRYLRPAEDAHLQKRVNAIKWR